MKIFQSKIERLNAKYQGLQWKRLEVSNAALNYFVGIDHVEYLDLLRDDIDKEKSDVEALLTFSKSGAHALNDNALWQALMTRLVRGTRRRPYKVATVDLDDNSWETVFRWCDDGEPGLENWEEEWRSLLS